MNISIIGTGGIGSNLVRSIAPAISTGSLVESIGGVKLMLFDSDMVEEKNLRLGQRFDHGDLGLSKVEAIKRSILGFQGENLDIEAHEHDIRARSDIPDRTLL